jgi:hypothetical protein
MTEFARSAWHGRCQRAPWISSAIHYAVQVALYTDILERKGLSASRKPFIWDIHGHEVVNDFNAPKGPKNPASVTALPPVPIANVIRVAGDDEPSDTAVR